jgi:alpha-glucosidase
MKLEFTQDSWALRHEGRLIIEHSPARPCCFVGTGTASVSMYHGNFDISDFVEERVALRHARIAAGADGLRVELARSDQDEPELVLAVRADASGAVIEFERAAPAINRVWWRVAATADEHVWGCGEQFSYFNLRGRHFPLWTSEPGVGRDKSTQITWQADVAGKAGGDYYTTYYPQPTFVSSARYCLHADTTAYADFDFRHADFHELQFWAVPPRLELFSGESFPELVERVSARFGRPTGLPEWVWKGAILGLKNGREHAERILDLSLARGVRVSALWCEDWVGIRQTSFGRRLFWDWHWNEARYPNGRAWVASLKSRGVRFLGYVTPYLCSDGSIYPEARAAGYLATNAKGGEYIVDFGEFGCGVVDFTNPEAARWYARRVIRREMIDTGLDGWMADFGEYLPTDMKLASGADPMLMHNAWPTMWAKVNADAIAEAGRTGDILFFMRAGFTGAQAHCPLLFSGDQSVDFSRHDGLQTVVCSALSSGILGNAFHNCDIGGYTSLFGNKRTPEVFQRWAEMAAFTPVMRTHEGNRPDDNFQFWQDEATLAHFARMTRINGGLVPYARRLAEQAVSRGLPLQRPLFLHFPGDRETYGIQDQYLYGEDLLVAPVHEGGRDVWQPYLPSGARWIHLWSGRKFDGGARVTVPAPLGQPPVFVRDGAPAQAELLGLAEA